MKKIKIEKKDEEITYRRSESVVEFSVNGKTLKVYIHEDYDEMQGSDYDIDEKDKATLTEEELEVFEDQDIWDLVRAKDGTITEVEGWED